MSDDVRSKCFEMESSWKFGNVGGLVGSFHTGVLVAGWGGGAGLVDWQICESVGEPVSVAYLLVQGCGGRGLTEGSGCVVGLWPAALPG